jgi:transposase-like protein
MERKERRHHTRELKLEAVRLAAVGDKTKAKIARELGIRVNQLRQWRLDFEDEERNRQAPRSDDLRRAGIVTSCGDRVHGALPFGTQPPGTGEPVDHSQDGG